MQELVIAVLCVVDVLIWVRVVDLAARYLV